MIWPTLAAVLIFSEASGLFEVNLGLGIGLLVAFIVGPRIHTDLLAEVAIVATTVAGAFFTVSSQVPEAASWRGDQLDGGWVFIGLIGLYTSVAWQVLKSPRGGHRTVAALNLVAVLACGSNEEFRMMILDDQTARSQLPYVLMVMGFGWFQFDALRKMDPVWFRVESVKKRNVIVFTLSVALAAPAIWAIPILHSTLISYARDQWKESRTGFSEHTELGELRGMLMSDRVILRVTGKKTEYLRGVVYDRYLVGRWIAPMRSPFPPAEWRSSEEPDTVIDTVSGARDRYFLPLNLASLEVVEGVAAVDDTGIFTAPSRSAGRVKLRTGTRGVGPIANPVPTDLDVPSGLHEPLERWLTEQQIGHQSSTSSDVVGRIADTLRSRYEYALQFTRDRDEDPVVDFLYRERKGHCEYFASAMTLLVRAAKIPARMVVGYRVSEWNPIGRYHIVRSRNAHAWTEVFYDGQWHTVDATAPSTLPMPTHTPVMSAIWDTMRALLSQGVEALAQMQWWAVLTLIGLLVLVWAGVRWQRYRRMARDARSQAYSAVLPAFVRLMQRLGRVGLARSKSESITDYVERVQRRVGREGPLASALGDYTAFRYGGVGEEDTVSESLVSADAWIRANRRRLSDGAPQDT